MTDCSLMSERSATNTVIGTNEGYPTLVAIKVVNETPFG